MGVVGLAAVVEGVVVVVAGVVAGVVVAMVVVVAGVVVVVAACRLLNETLPSDDLVFVQAVLT